MLMYGDPVVGIQINSMDQAVAHVINLFGGMGFKFKGSFTPQENHAIIKLERRREHWFYTMFRPVPFFVGRHAPLDLFDLERLAIDPRLEEVLFVLNNGKVFSCTVQDMISYGKQGSSECSVCISISSIKDIRNYTEYPQ